MGVRFAVLEARGWTRDLVALHSDRIGRPNRYFDDVAAAEIEQKAEWKEDAARAARGEPVAFGRAELKERGWSKSVIDQHLGEPDAVVDLSAMSTKHLWRATRVAAAELKEACTNDAAQALVRSESQQDRAAAQARRVRAEATVAAQALVVDVPTGWRLADLRTAAFASQSARDLASGGRGLRDPDDATLDRWGPELPSSRTVELRHSSV